LRGNGHQPKNEPLTEVQIGILSARASGKTRKEIAYSLGLSLKTVEYHFARIYRFLAVSNDIELTHYAIHSGLIPLKQYPSKRLSRSPSKVRVQKNA
jgi:DNA-binding NarL/FixJ family response regulator